MQVEQNVPLAALTTFGLGGPARFLIKVKEVEELQESLDYARGQNLATLILGGGSNVLIGEGGFDGLVIKVEIAGVEKMGDTLIAGAGEQWDALVARAVREGLWGIENLSGIPGTVGAAPIQNIGAYGAEVRDTLLWVEAFDTTTGAVVRLQNADCGFGYRTSRFKKEPGRYVVLRAAFALRKDGTPNTSYKDLTDCGKLNITQVRERVLGIRSNKFPDLSQEGTAGSFFLNPVVTAQKAAELLKKYPGLPHFAAEKGLPDGKAGVKLSLAWLLDNVLSLKGLSIGGARLYERQPLVIVVRAGASASDVRALAEKIKQIAREKLLLELEEEVRIIN